MRQIQVTNIYDKICSSKSTVIALRGGSRSTKSYSVCQYIIYKLTNNYNYKVVMIRKTRPSLKVTTQKDFLEIFENYGYMPYCDYNKTEGTLIYKPTNSFMLFNGLDDPGKMRSSGWNLAHMEEATDFTYEDYLMLKLRLSAPTDGINQLILSFNPIDAFNYVKTHVIDRDPEVDEIISTYKDNPFLSPQYIREIERVKELDPNAWKIYGKAEWGILEGLIFHNWEEIDKFPEDCESYYGVDFGFNDPTTVTKCGSKKISEDKIELYSECLLYNSDITNSDLIEWILNHLPSNAILYCDSEAPDKIEEMRRNDINAKPARKGQGSVNAGIDWMKSKKWYIVNNNTNTANKELIKEVRGYAYGKDRQDRPTGKPADHQMDHAIDGSRYAFYTYLANRIDYKIYV
jgi:phage terminase large subunit